MPYTYDEWERKVLLRRALTSALRAGRHLDLVAPGGANYAAPLTAARPRPHHRSPLLVCRGHGR
jgi:hypothetical protein